MKKYFVLIFTLALYMCTVMSLSAQWVNPQESVGIGHNKFVKSIFPKSFDKTKDLSEAKSLLRNELSKLDGNLTWVIDHSWTDPVYEVSFMARNGYINNNVLILVKDDIKYVLKGGLTLQDITSYVNSRGKSAMSLNKQEQKHYYSFLAGLSNSAKLWLSKNRGGENLIGSSNPIWPSDGGIQAWYHFNPWKALACDAVGCVLGPQAGGAATLMSAINQWH